MSEVAMETGTVETTGRGAAPEVTKDTIVGKDMMVRLVAAKVGASLKDTAGFVAAFYEAVKESADQGAVVRIPGVGSIVKSHKDAGTYRVPGTDRTVEKGERVSYKLRAKQREVESAE